jgi:calmodulin
MIGEVDENMSGSIDFAGFLRLIEMLKKRVAHMDNQKDMIDAWQACGGSSSKVGQVDKDALMKIIQTDFGLTVDIDEFIKQIDKNHNGIVEFEEFKSLLS